MEMPVSVGWRASNLVPQNLEEAREAVERLIRDGKRAGDVILRLRNFFKGSEGEKTSLKINEVVEGIVMLVRNELERNHVLLRTDLSERLPTVQGDCVQLQQVLLNLILNAAAAGRRGGSTKRVNNRDPSRIWRRPGRGKR
jgi:C4-dicarboxylate-specific signal transduction histidine kinase